MRARGLRRLAVAAARARRAGVRVGAVPAVRRRRRRPVRVAIPKQAGVGEIGDIAGPARASSRAATLFELRATLGGDRGDLKPGAYELRKDMSYGDVLDRWSPGPSSEIVIQLTIPEGLSRREIAPLAGRAGRARRLPARERRHVADRRRGYGLPDGAREPRGLPVPGHLRAAPRRSSAPALVRPPAGRVPSRTSRGWTSPTRAARTSPSSTWSRSPRWSSGRPRCARERTLVAAVIYNRLQDGSAARDRRHDPLRHRQLDADR